MNHFHQIRAPHPACGPQSTQNVGCGAHRDSPIPELNRELFLHEARLVWSAISSAEFGITANSLEKGD